MDDQGRLAGTAAMAVALICAVGCLVAGVAGAWFVSELWDYEVIQDQRLTVAEMGVQTAQTKLIQLYTGEAPAHRPCETSEE
jgi:hypothetical protein